MNTKYIGEISEAFIAAELLKMGFSVSRPIGDNQRYDMLIDSKGKFYRVQCKTGNMLANGSLQFPTASTYAHRGGVRKGYVGAAEFIVAYCHETNKCYFEEITEKTPKAAKTISSANLESRELKNIPIAQ